MTQDHAKSKVFKGSIRMFVIVMRVIRMNGDEDNDVDVDMIFFFAT